MEKDNMSQVNLPDFYLEGLNKLNEAELCELNRHIVEKLKLINKARSLAKMSAFTLGSRIYFMHEERKVLGIITRLNQRSVSIIADDGMRWTVAPQFLFKIIEQ